MIPRCRTIGAVTAIFLSLVFHDSVQAQRSGATPTQLQGIGIDEQLGATIPTNLTFLDENGREVKLGDFFDGETPVVLTLNYFHCRMLCGMQLKAFSQTLKEMKLEPGAKFQVVTVDFNPDETPADAREAKAMYVKMVGKKGIDAGWHFLTQTPDTTAIHRLTSAVGFRYRWVEQQKQYAHPAAYIFLSGTGKITRYLATLDPSPRDTRLALVEAGNGKVGSLVERLYLTCCVFDPKANSYVASAWTITKYVCYFIAVLLAGFLVFMWRLERSGRKRWGEQVQA